MQNKIVDRIKSEVLVEDLYQGDLRPSGRALVGKCPFHEDGTPSFAIYRDNNTWFCFAGCGSGDVIDFYMLWKELDFKAAVNQLKEEYL